MLTNQTMQVDILGEILKVEHKTWMGSLTDLFKIGNQERLQVGLGSLNPHGFLKSERMEEFVKEAATTWGLKQEEIIQIRGKGRNARTWAHLSVLIAAAEHLSPRVHNLVIKEFIEGRLLQFRDSSGDGYKLLSGLIDAKIPDKLGSQLIMEVAIAIRKKIKPPEDLWNLATAIQLQQRDQIEGFLCKSLEIGLIQSKEQLLSVVEKFKFKA